MADKILSRFGDVNPFVHGGSVLFEVENEGRNGETIVTQVIGYTYGLLPEQDEDDNTQTVEVYYVQIYDTLPSWINPIELKKFADISDDADMLVWFLAAVEYYGAHEFDHYPLKLTEHELKEQWEY